jgi:diguanylate cyclase (GGDEF)-like protein
VIITFAVAARQLLAARENYRLIITDNLTGLANRARLRIAMTRAAQRSRHTGRPMAMMVIDLDGFKQVNDGYGHEAGDAMLVTFAGVLRRTVRALDTPARLGGDEFAAVLTDVGEEDAVAVAQRILAEAARPSPIGGTQLPIRGSIGIAVHDPSAGEPLDIDQLLHRADLAMYSAKRLGAHGWQVFRPDGGQADVVPDLFRAIQTDAIEVEYQPVVDLASGDLVGVEASARWTHPAHGPIDPERLVKLAEEVGAIHALGSCVLRRAVRQVRDWQDRQPAGRELRLSVNVSALQLTRPDLPSDVFAVLDEVGFDPRHLVIEITESAVVDNAGAIGNLATLRTRGIRIALDDFGTGYSSLRLLRDLPVDTLKLDRCFVADLDSDGHGKGSRIAEAMIRLAQTMELETVAAGIEQPAEAIELALLGCAAGQGHHFAGPLTADAMDQLISDPRSRWSQPPVAARAESAYRM